MVTVFRWLGPLILIPYFIMLGSGLLLPSDGDHGLLSPKSLSFLGTSYLIIIYFFFRNRFNDYQLKLVTFTIAFITFLLCWALIGLANNYLEGPTAVLDQFKIFLITLIFIVVTLYLINENILNPRTFLRTTIILNLSFCLIKVVAMTLHYFKIIKLLAFLELVGIRVMSMNIAEGLSRLQTSVDIVTPYFVYFVLQSDALNLGFSRRFRYFYCLVALLAILLSFSRFLLMVGCLSAFLYWLTLNIPRFTKALIFCIFLTCGAVAMVGIDNAEKAILLRFASYSSYASDRTRVEQVEALLEEYEQVPTLGKGLGGSAPKYLRDDLLTHSYEVQWIAFLMQFGALGILLLLIPVIYIMIQFLSSPLKRVQLGFLALFILWILSGFTNPYLISLTSGIIYTSFLVAAQRCNNHRNFYRI